VGKTHVHGISWRAFPIAALPRNNTLLQKPVFLRTYLRTWILSNRTNFEAISSQTTTNGGAKEKIIFLL